MERISWKQRCRRRPDRADNQLPDLFPPENPGQDDWSQYRERNADQVSARRNSAASCPFKVSRTINCKRQQGDSSNPHQNTANRTSVRSVTRAQISQREQQQSLHRPLPARVMSLRNINPFCRQPRGREHCRKRSLHPITQNPPRDPGCRSPQHDAARPMLLQIENLCGKINPGSSRDRSDSMQRHRQFRKAARGKCAAT